MNRAGRAVALAAVAVSGLALAACGSSGSSTLVAVPVVQEQGVDQAAVALFKAGLRISDSVYVPGMRDSSPTVPPKYIAEPAFRGVFAQPIMVTGTRPAGGTRVTPGSTVWIVLAGRTTKYSFFVVPTRQCVPTKAPGPRT
jgi:beta-lactam-binding protein with PASTA domain